MKMEVNDFNWGLIDDLNSEEVRSLLKSNIIPLKIRKQIRIRLGFKGIHEALPIITGVICAASMLGIIQQVLIEVCKKK